MIEYYLDEKRIDATLNRLLNLGDIYMQDEVIKIIKNILNFDEEKRFSIREILNSSLFKDFHNDSKIDFINPIIERPECDINSYIGYDILFRLCTKLTILLETFFLAADIISTIDKLETGK